jgi:hypothetical protein
VHPSAEELVPSLRLALTRRSLLGRTSTGLGTLALAGLLNPHALHAAAVPARSAARGALPGPHFPPRARRIIQLYMAGGPSHLETWDYKPKLAEMHGQDMPDSFTRGQQIAQLQGAKLRCLAPQHPFEKVGRNGQEISTVFPHLMKLADELCIVRSLHTDAINHDPAHTFMNTGSPIPGRPAFGSWLWYGLGSETEDLPGFVVLTSLGKYGQAQPIAARQWHSGFLPGNYQGVEFRSRGQAVLYSERPPGVTPQRQRDVVEAVAALNRLRDATVDDPEISARIHQYELAFRMQTSVPALLDLSAESPRTLEMYGTRGADGSFAANCLLARRLAERGVRFIQLYHRDWDHHGAVKSHVAGTAAEVDRPAWALLTDLKERGMLEDTLVLWNGEFGRTPMAQGDGRDHHIAGYSIWMAGGGVRPGITYGATDELGYKAIENPVHVHDLHATILRLFGVDHERLTYRIQGREMRLTDIAGKVVEVLLA